MRFRRQRTDAELLARSVDDPEIFRLVFERHFDAVWRYLRRRVGADADDLAAETFAQAFAVRSRYRPEHESALPWLLGIATNLARRGWRRETEQLRGYARLGFAAPDEIDVDGIAGRLADIARGPELAAAIAALRDEDRETLLLSVIASLSHAEIAEALDVAPGTVGARLHRIRAQLGAALTTEEEPLHG